MTRPPPLVAARGNPLGYLEARARPGTGRRGEVLARFLESDVQSDRGAAAALLKEIAAARRSAAPRPAIVGNAFSLTIAAEGAVIANAVVEGEPPQRYTLDELVAALTLWRAAIESRQSGGG